MNSSGTFVTALRATYTRHGWIGILVLVPLALLTRSH